MLTFLLLFSCRNRLEKYCLGEGYTYIKSSPTIQTISLDTDSSRILRGHIQLLNKIQNKLVGYLNIENFEIDGLVGLEGQNDIEGFFIIDIAKQELQVGLDKLDLIKIGVKDTELTAPSRKTLEAPCLKKQP